MAQLTPDFFQTILKMEGGYQAMAADRGNYNTCGELVGTNRGVSAVAYSNWVGRCVGVAEMMNLDLQTTQNFYRWYFDKYNCFQIEDQKLANLIMNNTMGAPFPAIKAEQRALNRMGYKVAVDGNRGPATVAAINQAAKKNFQGIYNLIREEWLRHLMSISPQFQANWKRRMDQHFPPIQGGGNPVAWEGAFVLSLVALGGVFIYKQFNRK